MKLNNNDHQDPPSGLQLSVDISHSSLANYLSTDNIVLPPVLSGDEPISVLGLPVRLENALVKQGGINTVREFCNIPDGKLIKIRNIGRKSVNYLFSVKQAINQKFGVLPTKEIQDSNTRKETKEIEIPQHLLIDTLLERCGTERSMDVIRRRYGLIGGYRQTLEEIGEEYGVTRERIRQIQVKALNRMKRPVTYVRRPLTELVETVLFSKGGLLTAEEADEEIPKALKVNEFDGSALLDLLTDLGWIQSCRIGDIKTYSPALNGVSLCKLIDSILLLIKREDLGLDAASVVKNSNLIRKIKDIRFNPVAFVLRYCNIDPRIEEVKLTNLNEPVFRHYTSGNFATKNWVALMARVLEEEQMPLHFTEIANRVNDLLGNSTRVLDVRRAHSIMIEHETFAHSGIHGTYGLTAWGLRKESTVQLVEECLRKAGFPLHWKQIFNYVSKYKDSKPASIISILENRSQFRRVNSGTFWFNEE